MRQPVESAVDDICVGEPRGTKALLAAIALKAYTPSRSANSGLLLVKRRSLVRRALASVSENVVSSTRLFGCLRARYAARCTATIVLPVRAEPETCAGPL
jgi:hypothetical protein